MTSKKAREPFEPGYGGRVTQPTQKCSRKRRPKGILQRETRSLIQASAYALFIRSNSSSAVGSHERMGPIGVFAGRRRSASGSVMIKMLPVP